MCEADGRKKLNFFCRGSCIVIIVVYSVKLTEIYFNSGILILSYGSDFVCSLHGGAGGRKELNLDWSFLIVIIVVYGVKLS